MEENKKSSDNIEILRTVEIVGLIAIGSILIISIIYFLNFHGTLSSNQTVWGEFGDYFGGILNPILSFFALIALLLTIVLQSNDLSLTREQLIKTSTALQEQEKNQQQQIFENTFFQLLKSHISIVEVMVEREFSQDFKGKACFGVLLRKIQKSFEEKLEKSTNSEPHCIFENSFNEIYNSASMHLDVYFRSLNGLLKFVDTKAPPNTSITYIEIIQNQMPNQEFQLIASFYIAPAFGNLDWKNELKRLILKYKLLTHGDYTGLLWSSLILDEMEKDLH